MIFLSKLLPIFLYPLGAAIGACALALALSFTRFLVVARILIAIAVGGLTVASTPVFANWLGWQLESQYPPKLPEQLPASDAIVVLGGALAQPLPPRLVPNLAEGADRIVEAWRLFRARRAPRIIVSGGNIAWQAGVAPEAELIADMLVELGVPQAAIVVEGASRNTRENAVNTAAILERNGWRHVLLVTSAAHMPRAVATFAKAGVAATPAPADVQVRLPFHDGVLDFLPEAAALARTTSSVKELLGLCVCRLKDWA